MQFFELCIIQLKETQDKVLLYLQAAKPGSKRKTMASKGKDKPHIPPVGRGTNTQIPKSLPRPHGKSTPGLSNALGIDNPSTIGVSKPFKAELIKSPLDSVVGLDQGISILIRREGISSIQIVGSYCFQ